MFLGGRDRLGRSGRLGHHGDSLDRAEQADHAHPEDGVVVDHEQAQVWLAHASAPTALIMAASGTTTRTSVPPETAAEIVTWPPTRSEEHPSELQSLMRNSYAAFSLKQNSYLQ